MADAQPERFIPKNNDAAGGDEADQQALICCQASHVDISESTAMILFIINLVTLGSLGTLISACIDRNGCNWSAFGMCFVPLVGNIINIINMYYIW